MPKSDYFPPNIKQYLDQGWERDSIIELANAPLSAKSDLIIMRKIISTVGRELNLIAEIYPEERQTMPEADFFAIYNDSWVRWLDNNGFCRSIMRRGEINGLGPEMSMIVRAIFPNIEHYNPLDEDYNSPKEEPPARPPVAAEQSSKVETAHKGGLFSKILKRLKGE